MDAHFSLFVLLKTCCFSCIASLPFSGMNEYSENYKLPSLPYSYDALEPYIDEATVRVHHTGHHMAYTNKLNDALAQWRSDPDTEAGDLSAGSIIDIITHLNDIPDVYRTAIRNNGGGYVNHNIYWSVIMPNPDGQEGQPKSNLYSDIERDFGNFSNFKQHFTREAAKLFGSGYVWLSRQFDDKSLVVSTTANQDCPLTQGLHPILVLDIWEHAYYLKHQNRRPDHVADWWKLVNWESVAQLDAWWGQQVHDEL